MPVLDLKKIRVNFPNLRAEIYGKPLVYLDNAATTFKPTEVLHAMDHHFRRGTSNVHRGVHFLSEQATAAFENARRQVKEFLNARGVQEIIFTSGSTESINLVAQSYGRSFLKSGDEIILSHMEHHSNIVPWQILSSQTGAVIKVVPINDAG